jgi:glycosyltransferase involved in cell wall biosynthesis
MTTSTSMINILHVIDKFSMDNVNPSSCTRLFDEWASWLDPEKFRLIFCGLKKPEPAGRWLEDKGLKVYYLNRGKFSPGIVSDVIELVRKEEIHLLHLHGYSSHNFGRIAARKLGIPSIVHEHAVLDVLPHQYIMDFLLRNRTDIAVALSGAVKEFLVRGRSVPPEKVVIIGNGIDLRKFEKPDSEIIRGIRKELNIPSGSRIVGTITRLREEKGTRYFIESAAKVHLEFPNARFVVVGDGPLRNELETLSHRLGLRDVVLFTGYTDDPSRFLSIFEIAVIPSLREGFCLALIEAMAMEKPIVATKVGAIPEIATDGVDAILVPSKNGDVLSKEIISLLNDREKTGKLARSAKETSDRYSIEASVEKIEDLYRKMLNHAQSDSE